MADNYLETIDIPGGTTLTIKDSGAARTSHTHGNIQDGGTLQTSDVTIATGDKLVVTDASDSNKIARTSASFDGSTTTKCLTQKGTFETFGTSNLAVGTGATDAAAGNHTHGNVTNAGTITASGVTIASGDALAIVDSSDSSKIAKTSVTFDGSTTTKALTQKGTFESFLQSHQTIKQDGVTGATVNRFGTCSTAAATAAKTVSITTGTFSLEAGARVSVKFTNANTADTPTLNVNSKGAKNIYSKGSQITTGGNKALLAGTVDFIYDGTQWHLIGNYIDTNTTYSGDNSAISIATGNVITHATSAGYKHIPAAGSTGQFLGYDSAGTAKWVNNPNTDTKVNVTLATTSKAYLLGTTTTPTSTATGVTSVADTNVYLDTAAGKLTASTINAGSFTGNGVTTSATSGSSALITSGGVYTALSGKQNSLSTSQLAAVNSGIDSTKVGQISTNKSNILYALRKVGTNMFNFEAWANKVAVTNSGTKSVSENTITISATTNSDTYTDYSANEYPVDARIPVNAGDKLYMSWDYSSADNVTGNVYIFGNASTSSMASADATAGHLEYTVPASGISYITMRVGLGTNQSGKSGTWSNIQIIMKSAYDSGTTEFAPYALPNYDLTRLEAEDRAALAEEIDAGAKNKLKINSYTCTSGVGRYGRDDSLSIPAGDYVLIAKINQTANSALTLVWDGTQHDFNLTGAASNTIKTWNVKATNTITSAWVYFNATNDTWTDVMLCTKAAFGVSSKFVPYRPNWDLVANRYNSTCLVKTYEYTPTAADTYEELPPLKITLPSEKMLRITASAIFQVAYAKGIMLIRGNTVSDPYTLAKQESDVGLNTLAVSTAYTAGSAQDIHVYVKATSKAAIKVVVVYDII